MKLHLLIAGIVSLFVANAAQSAAPTLAQIRDPEVVAAFTTLPVQESGRIKPLDTVARYRLLRFHGTRTLRFVNPDTGKKDKLSAIEWLLVTWFNPELSKTLPLFRVDNPAAITEIGGTAKDRMEGVKGQYTYNDIVPFRAKLMDKAQEYRELDPKNRTAEQRMIADLGINFLDYEMMVTHMDMFRAPFGPNAKAVPEELAKSIPQPYRIATLLPAVLEYVKKHPEAAAPMANPWMMDLMKGALGGMMSGNEELSLRIFPPAPGATEKWHGPGWIAMEGLRNGEVTPADLKWLTEYENVFLAASDPAKFKEAAKGLAAKVKEAAAARGEGGTVDLEASYHRADYFYYALCIYVLGLILIASTWVSSGGAWTKWGVRATWVSVLIATGLAVAGITVRALIMQRPSITTLYETIICITAVGAILCMIGEWITRKNIALFIATIVGAAGFFLSIRFETHDAGDTMVQLQAVLITNFWLATHVPMINFGYSASLIAAIISMVYTIRRIFNNLSKDERRDFSRISYGFLCIGLFLSLVGTILGGIWANDSWGRFWGWDPKENGALMIVLMTLIILHARLGGYIREIGLHACNLLLGCVTVFSWFGTNQLGVGLHAYGFTDGVWGWLRLYWGVQLGLLVGLLVLKLRDRNTVKQESESTDAALSVEA